MFMEDEPIPVWSIGYVENDFGFPTYRENVKGMLEIFTYFVKFVEFKPLNL